MKSGFRPARLFIEAMCGLNDVFPGDPYPDAPLHTNTVRTSDHGTYVCECGRRLHIGEVPVITPAELADFLKSHQQQVANLLDEIERLRGLAALPSSKDQR